MIVSVDDYCNHNSKLDSHPSALLSVIIHNNTIADRIENIESNRIQSCALSKDPSRHQNKLLVSY